MSKTFHTEATTDAGGLESGHARTKVQSAAYVRRTCARVTGWESQRIGEGAHGVVLKAKHLKVGLWMWFMQDCPLSCTHRLESW